MSSLIDYIFMKSLDKCVVIIVNNLTSSKLCVEIQGEKYHSCPSMNYVIMDNILNFPPNTNLFIFCDVSWFPLLSNLCYVLPWSITIFYVKNVVNITPPLKNSWYSDTSHHHHSFLVPVLFLNEIPTNGLWCVNSKLLATLLLWSYWSIVSFYVYGLLNHHSNIYRATHPIFRVHLWTKV